MRRLAFGHARHEDLVAYLVDRVWPVEAQPLAGAKRSISSPANLATISTQFSLNAGYR